LTAREKTACSDKDLLRQIAAGDERSLGELYDRHAAILLGLVLRILRSRSEAEDVLQETFLQIWRRAADFDEHRGQPFSWMALLARSRALDRVRALEVRERVALEARREPTEAAVDLVDHAAAGETGRIVRQALQRIPDSQREVLLLAYFDGLTQSEIAARLARPLGTVKTQARAGLAKLRELLQR
jgi:RNA polymerase sigma-70 factor (ECF subfamily)